MNGACAAAATFEKWAPIVVLGMHHEQQHQELIVTDIKHVLAQNPLYPVYRDRPVRTGAKVPDLKWIEFGGGLNQVGYEGDGFFYDNEGPRHTVFVQPFKLANRLVTNGEFMEFIEDVRRVLHANGHSRIKATLDAAAVLGSSFFSKPSASSQWPFCS